MEQIGFVYPDDKKEMYSLLLPQMKALLQGERHVVSNLSNASALLSGALTGINWVGFYLMHGGELLLGPFQGKVACVHITLGKGVCGTAAAQNLTQIVDDVHQFRGHIACDSNSRSEIVIPLRNVDRIVGVLDIDSPAIGRFDTTDAFWLEKIARVISEACDWD